MKKRGYRIVNHKKQWKYSAFGALIVILSLAINNFLLMYLNLNFLYAENRIFDPEILGKYFIKIIIISSIVSFILLGGLIFFGTLILTHRYEGPIIRISRFIEILKEGKYGDKIKLRPWDELDEVATKLTELSESLKKRHEDTK